MLWHLKISYEFVGDEGVDGPGVHSSHLKIDPVTVDLDINEIPTAEQTSISANFNYFCHWFDYPFYPDQGTLPNEYTVTGSGKTQDCQVDFGRCIAACDPGLAWSDPMAEGDDTFFLRLTVNAPVSSTAKIADHQPSTNTIAEPIQFPVNSYPYQFQQPSNNGTIVPPPPNDYTPKQNSITFDLEARPMQLKYTPLNQDARAMSSFAGTVGKYKAVPGSPNLAGDVNTGWFLHANNQLQVFVDNNDVTPYFATWRFVRVWTSTLDQSRNLVGQYNPILPDPSDTGADPKGWRDDNLSDPNYNLRKPDWTDTPGDTSLPNNPTKWPLESTLYEFGASVYRFPEFKVLYYTIIIDTHTDAFQVRTFDAQELSVDEWCAARAQSETPYMLHSAATGLETGWLNHAGKPA